MFLQICNWKLKKSVNSFRIAVCEGHVPYGPFMTYFMCCQICMLDIVVWLRRSFFSFATKETVWIDLCFMWILAGQFFFFNSLCLIFTCLPASAAISWNLPYYCVQFLHVKNVLLDFRLTNAAFLFNWTCASVKQRLETFQKMLVRNPPLWFFTVRWCAISLSIILILGKK